MNLDHLNQLGAMVSDLEAQQHLARLGRDPIGRIGQYVNGAEMASGIADLLKSFLHSQRFIVPEAGQSTIGQNISYSSKHFDLLYLPYDAVTVLYKQSFEEGPGDNAVVPDLVVCVFTKALPNPGFFRMDAKPAPGGELVYCRTVHRLEGEWCLSPSGLAMDIGHARTHGGGVPVFRIPTIPSPRLYRLVETADAFPFDSLDKWYLAVLVDLCCALACSNVRADEMQPPPRLQAARIRKGKRPLFSYHVLTVDTGDQPGETHGTGGARASPRSHLRRGHIRRLPSGKVIWINATMVRGATPGFVAKDYRIAPSVDAGVDAKKSTSVTT